MLTITKSSELRELCERAANEKYITSDTEFLRERNDFYKVGLVKLAFPGVENQNEGIVDI